MQPSEQSRHLRRLAALAPVIPVLVIDDAAVAPRLGQALVAGGLPVLEVTLRRPAALEAIRALASVAGARVGAGTVLTPEDAAAAQAAGAGFAVSPGLTPALAEACTRLGLPLLPGAITASEVMAAMALGYDMLKFFPAATSGGAAALAALSGPLPSVDFCPTGGITAANASDYLGLPNVPCVGGTWIAPPAALAAASWEEIEASAREAAALPRAWRDRAAGAANPGTPAQARP